MSLKINLYHEVIRARRDEQYDPLRLSMIALLIVATGLVGYYVYALAEKTSVESAFRKKQAAYNELEPKVKKATEEEVELNKLISVSDNLSKRMEERFYWGPVFEHLIAAVPPKVQITRCSGEIGSDPTRRGQMSIEGVAAGEEPRKVAEDLRVDLEERLKSKFKNVSALFRSLEDGTEKVTFVGAKLPTANFTIAINFTYKEAPPATPTPAPRRSKRIAQQPQ
jgi:hypothetical protein